MMGSFPECDVKLCDFEISRVILEGTEVREILGTPDYVGECGVQYLQIVIELFCNFIYTRTHTLMTKLIQSRICHTNN